MALFRKVSSLVIYSRLGAATAGNFPSSLLAFVPEWLDQAMRRMRTKMELITTSKIVEVTNHKFIYPERLISLSAVEYNGYRLRIGTDKTDLQSQSSNYHKSGNRSSQSTFELDATKDFSLKGSEIVPTDLATSSSEYYIPYANSSQTSFKEGLVKLHYKTLECDDNGYPLIPDNEAYKSACVDYIISVAIESGAYEHGIPYSTLVAKMEENMAMAINQISYPTPEKSFSVARATVNLVPRIDDHLAFHINREV